MREGWKAFAVGPYSGPCGEIRVMRDGDAWTQGPARGTDDLVAEEADTPVAKPYDQTAPLRRRHPAPDQLTRPRPDRLEA